MFVFLALYFDDGDHLFYFGNYREEFIYVSVGLGYKVGKKLSSF